MDNINEFLSSKVSKTLKKNIFNDCQADSSESAGYRTIDLSKEKAKYKYGFIDINDEDEYITLVGFNDPKDFEDLLLSEEGTFDELAKVPVGGSTTIDDGSSVGIYRRIW